MKKRSPIPTCIWCGSLLFIVVGIVSLADIVISRREYYFPISVGALGLLIGPGLIRLSKGCRGCGLFLSLLAMLGIPVVVLFYLFGRLPMGFKVLGFSVCEAPVVTFLPIAGILYAIIIWQYRVLSRVDTRLLFDI